MNRFIWVCGMMTFIVNASKFDRWIGLGYLVAAVICFYVEDEAKHDD